ncbi:cupin domain-containing protein [Diaphorobacter limosus]|uniref:Cupin domain-containing protein n=1 Tax=Diaphorobacter limosus TaxID=3036128 RepID=A0ABZ0J2M4_9BURK|nr:cupin domain-containing protein [Diaphorobacter sp. Y-1]WOO31805.1 cupin domain-containing protein [Diaphorobacter sp. Y-1]
MTAFAHRHLPQAPDVLAPDGSEVRILLAFEQQGSMAHFRLPAGAVAKAVVHASVQELWYVLEGRGQMWRRQGEGEHAREEVLALEPGLCLSIPVGTRFQFRAALDAPLSAVAITLPPWPGADEAQFVQGPWVASV